MANAIAKGKAIIATVEPATISDDNFARSYPSFQIVKLLGSQYFTFIVNLKEEFSLVLSDRVQNRI